MNINQIETKEWYMKIYTPRVKISFFLFSFTWMYFSVTALWLCNTFFDSMFVYSFFHYQIPGAVISYTLVFMFLFLFNKDFLCSLLTKYQLVFFFFFCADYSEKQLTFTCFFFFFRPLFLLIIALYFFLLLFIFLESTENEITRYRKWNFFLFSSFNEKWKEKKSIFVEFYLFLAFYWFWIRFSFLLQIYLYLDFRISFRFELDWNCIDFHNFFWIFDRNWNLFFSFQLQITKSVDRW